MAAWLRIGQLAMAVAVATVAAVLLSSSMNFSSETVLVQKHGASGISSLASALQQDESQLRSYIMASPPQHHAKIHARQMVQRMHEQHRAGLLSQIEADADSQLAEAKHDKEMRAIPDALSELKHAALQQLRRAPSAMKLAASPSSSPSSYFLRDDGQKIPMHMAREEEEGSRGRGGDLTEAERAFVHDSLSSPKPLASHLAATGGKKGAAGSRVTSVTGQRLGHNIVWPGEPGHVTPPHSEKGGGGEHEEGEKQGADDLVWPHDAGEAPLPPKSREGEEEGEKKGGEEGDKQAPSPFKESEHPHDHVGVDDGLGWPSQVGGAAPAHEEKGEGEKEGGKEGGKEKAGGSPFKEGEDQPKHQEGEFAWHEPGQEEGEEEKEKDKKEQEEEEKVGSDDGLAWPDGQEFPVTAPPKKGAEWAGPGSEMSWPQVPKQQWSGVPSKLEVLLLLEGVSSASLSATDTRLVRATLAQLAPLSLAQVTEDYAVNVPGLAGHVEMALHLHLPASVDCNGMENHIREAFEEEDVENTLKAFGVRGVSASLLGLSGCPAPDLPRPDYAVASEEEAPLHVEAKGASQQSLSEHMAPGERARQFVEARRERGGKRGQEEAIDAARQVATQTAQQVASQVATAAARQTALRLEDELRDIAAKVAQRTVQGASQGRREAKSRSALQSLLRVDARRAARRALE